MRRLRCSLAALMCAVVLAAADLAALRHVVGPVEEGIPLNLILSLLPMANVAAIVGYRLIRAPRTRRPFALGFLTCGLAAMAAHAACDLAIPAVMASAYAWPFRAAVTFCRTHQVPGFFARAPGGATTSGTIRRWLPSSACLSSWWPFAVGAPSVSGPGVRSRRCRTRHCSGPAARAAEFGR